MCKRLKWAVLSVIWILMRLIMIPLDMFLAISCTIGILYHNAHVLYCNMLYKRFLALYGVISVEIGILEAGADEEDYIKQTGEYKERMLKVIKRGNEKVRMNRTSKNSFVRVVEAVAYKEREIRAAVQTRREEIASEVNGENPTADNAIYLSDGIISVVLPDGQEVERPEIWLEAFDNARAVCQSVGQLDELEILKARYGRGRRGGEHQNATCERLHISPTSYQRKLDNLRYILTIAAVEKGLIRISPK